MNDDYRDFQRMVVQNQRILANMASYIQARSVSASRSVHLGQKEQPFDCGGWNFVWFDKVIQRYAGQVGKAAGESANRAGKAARRPADHVDKALGSSPSVKDEVSHDHTAEKKVFFDTSRYTAANLSEHDLSKIISLYGNAVQDIYELAAGQKWMLEEGKHVKSAFFLQILTKAVISLDPATFRQQADLVCEKHENLRSAFVYRNVKHPYRVVLKDRHPEINYFDLSDISMEEFDKRISKMMEADRRRGFDLEKDSLLRISVYKSCEKDTYALIVSQPHINSDGTSLGILFGDLFVGYALDLNGIDKKIEEQSYQAYAEHLQNVDIDKELSWWKEFLGDMREDVLLPGQHPSDLEYKRAEYFAPFSEDDVATLKAYQKKLKVTQFTLLQTLWGIMIARLGGEDSIVFGAVTSGRDAEVSDSMKLDGGFVNAIPVSIQFSEDEKYVDLVKRAQENFVRCLENSHCSPGQIQRALDRSQPVFGHILNNHNFVKTKQSISSGDSLFGIRILGGDTYDNLSADLCIYFTEKEGKPGTSYSYNERAFSSEVIQLLSEHFMKMISALADVTEDTVIGDLPALDADLILAVQDNERIRQAKIASYMKKHPLFGHADDNELFFLADECVMTSFAEDETIVRIGEKQGSIPILMRGRAIVYGETRDGWNNPVRILRQGSVLSYAALLGRKEENIITSGEDDTVILFVPSDVLLNLMETHAETSLRIITDLMDQRKTYMKLWLNAG